ncbi:AraC family transcriptional regulator [Myceligenerans cantabricum]
MGDSSGVAPETAAGHGAHAVVRDSRLLRVRPDGTPVYGYDQRPGVPAIGVTRMAGGEHQGPAPLGRRHVHDFHVLVYVHRGGGSVRVDGVERPLRGGDVFGVVPGQAVDAGQTAVPGDGLAWSVQFLPDVVPALVAVSPLAWDRHPLLRIFAPDDATGAGPGGRARATALVPAADRQRWRGWLEDVADEAAHPERTGARDAMVAGLTRVLVAAARLAPGPSSAPDPLLLRVFDEVERTFSDPVSAGDVARALGYTPGHLTTVVRERSGRTVGDWLSERRLTEARRLLVDTDLPLGAVAARTGLRDGAYLGRRFRDRYGTSPDRWRRERRATGPAR